jgi:hypothetical protein
MYCCKLWYIKLIWYSLGTIWPRIHTYTYLHIYLCLPEFWFPPMARNAWLLILAMQWPAMPTGIGGKADVKSFKIIFFMKKYSKFSKLCVKKCDQWLYFSLYVNHTNNLYYINLYNSIAIPKKRHASPGGVAQWASHQPQEQEDSGSNPARV